VVPALAPLRLRPFRTLLASYGLNELGDWLGSIALAILVFGATHDALATTALFLASKFLPALASPVIAARLDRIAIRRSLPLLYLGEAAAFVGLAATAQRTSLGVVLGLALIDGALALAGRALTRAATATVLEPAGQLREGNALLGGCFAVAAVCGPAAGGLVVAGFGVESALAGDAALFFVMALMLALDGSLPRPVLAGDGRRSDLRDAVEHVRSRPALTRLLVVQVTALVCFSAVVPIEVVYAKGTLAAGDAGLGAFMGAWGIGVLAGSLIFAVLRRRSTWALLVASTATIGAAYVGIALAGSLALACTFAAVGGIGNGIEGTSVVVAVQESVAPAFRTRVLSLLESVGAAVPGAAFVLGGVVASLGSARSAYAAAGTGALAVAAAAWLVQRARRRVQRAHGVTWSTDPSA
jgi:predicted MFS family arabinose efflux permease